MNKDYNYDYFDQDLYKKIYDIGSFRAFCDLKRNKSSVFDEITIKEPEKEYVSDSILDEQFHEYRKFYSKIDEKEQPSSILDEKPFQGDIPKMYCAAPDAEEIKVPKMDDLFREQEINRLFSMRGLTYKFDRGLIMTDKNGKKIEDIFDGTSKHHAIEICEVARDEFGIDVDFLGVAMDFRESVDASNKGLAVMLLEGNIGQIYLPEDVTNEMLDQILEEVKLRDDFVFFIVRDIYATNELLQDEVVNYLESLYVKDEVKDEDVINNMDKLTVDEYLVELLSYTIRNRISVYDYFLTLVTNYRKGNFDDVLEFEKRSPFINSDNIKALIDCNEEKIEEYFANTMNRVVLLNLIKDNNDTKENKDSLNDLFDNNNDTDEDKDSLNDLFDNNNDTKDDSSLDYNELLDAINDKISDNDMDVQITSVNVDILNTINGFALINEPRRGVLSVYGFDASNPDELKGRTIFENVPGHVESGFYINFMEFEKAFRNQYVDSEISFVTEDGDELDYNVVMDAALEISRSGGAIRFGKEYKDEDINSKNDLDNLYTGEVGTYKGNELYKGMFVNRDILFEYFSKLQIKVKKQDEVVDYSNGNDLGIGFEYVR